MTLYPASSSTRGATSVAGSDMLSVNHSEIFGEETGEGGGVCKKKKNVHKKTTGMMKAVRER